MVIHRPSFDVDTLEGALLHMISICYTLSTSAIDAFARRYAAAKGKPLPQNYVSEVLIPRLRKQRKIFQTSRNIYALNPLVYYNEAGLSAFWAFLPVSKDVDLYNVFHWGSSAQISYLKNGFVYHIVYCHDDGAEEMIYEVGAGAQTKLPRKYFFVFKNEEYMRAAKLLINVPSMYAVVDFEDRAAAPSIKYFDPKQLQS